MDAPAFKFQLLSAAADSVTQPGTVSGPPYRDRLVTSSLDSARARRDSDGVRRSQAEAESEPESRVTPTGRVSLQKLGSLRCLPVRGTVSLRPPARRRRLQVPPASHESGAPAAATAAAAGQTRAACQPEWPGTQAWNLT